MSEFDLDTRILQHVNHPNYCPVKPRVIAKKLEIDDSLLREFKRSIKRLAKKGKIVYGKNHLVMGKRGDTSKNEIVGRFKRTQGGFGFVRPDGTKKLHGRDLDVFIPAAKTKDAANDDVVRVRLSGKKSQEGKLSGDIIEVVERSHQQYVGTYSETDGMGFVRIDGGQFKQPLYVGDPGASRVQPDDKVVVEIVRYPSATRNGEGVITEIIGKRGEPGVDTKSIILEYNLPGEFPEEALDNARSQAAAFDESISDGRVDLTGTTVLTIDPFDARDFDDAISLEKLENGHWKLGVHIADVSHFVQPGSPLDIEAKDRATSVYLPDMVIPMIPEIISNNLASLQPDRVRYAKTAFIEFTEEGVRVATDFCNSAIKSDRRFTYEEVDEYLEDREPWREKLTKPVFDLVGNMHHLAMILRKRRLDHGSMELHLPEVKLVLDKDGKVVNAKVVENTESHQVIEEFMLAANEAVAERFNDDELVFLRRIHESPDPRKLKSLTRFVREIGIECESLESRFEIKKVLAQVHGQPDEKAVNFAVLRSMQKAVYSPEVIGHYALASTNYCHFTSPIRRYPDLTIHRAMDKIFRGQPASGDFAVMSQLGEHCSEREQRAESAERELKKVKLLALLAGRIGQHMEALITGVEDFGLFAQGIELPAEGLIHIRSMEDDHYFFDSETHSLMGHRKGNQFRIGDKLTVEIANVDIDKRELDFKIVIHSGRKAPPEAAARAVKPRVKETRRTNFTSKKERRKNRKR